MAGKLVVSTLNNDTGVLATQNGMTGIAKAWVIFVGSTAVVNGSFNVSSVTRNGTGVYTVNFTTAMSNANYATAGMATGVFNGTYLTISNTGGSDATNANATTSSTFVTRGGNGSAADPALVAFTVFSS